MKRPSDFFLLTRLFLRQFLETDLLSPDSDRSQLLAVVGASVISLTLFISVFMSAPYSMSILGPGQAAILTLNDKFFYVAAELQERPRAQRRPGLRHLGGGIRPASARGQISQRL